MQTLAQTLYYRKAPLLTKIQLLFNVFLCVRVDYV